MRHEKYSSELRFNLARARRVALMSMIRPLIRWRPMTDPRDGYTIIIAAGRRLLPILAANLTFLARQNLSGAREILVVIDERAGGVSESELTHLRSRISSTPLRFVHYSSLQAAVAQQIDWGWVYSWISWCLGLSESTTRWVLLHDLDALLLGPDAVAARYAAACTGRAQFIGVRQYIGGGVTADDNLVTTFELMLDAAFVRERYAPIQVFNQVRRVNGRRLDLDTFLFVQLLGGERKVAPIKEEDMVHPSQMICQYVDHVTGRGVPAATHNLFMLPYYLELGGTPGPLRETLRGLQRDPSNVNLFGRPVDATRISHPHVAWYIKQAGRAEEYIHGGWRSEIREYFDAIAAGIRMPLPSVG